MNSDKIAAANAKVFGIVHGWLGERVYQVIQAAADAFTTNNVTGSIVEIGIHHGKFFFIIDGLRNQGEVSIAIDIFDQQEKNVDQSGHGSRKIFEKHLDDLFPGERQHIKVVQQDSMSFTPRTFADLLGPSGAKFISIDGGHTADHVSNDLSLAQEVLNPYGVVALDDFFGPHWPSVTEGFYKFANTLSVRLKPFIYFQNKLFLTTLSEHHYMLQNVRDFFERLCPEEIHSGRWRYVEICHSKCLSFA